MSLETHTYFIIVLSGFGLVWGFRKGIGSRKEISDFEYLGFSAFWGVVILGFWEWMYRSDPTKFSNSLQNPYASGAALFLVSVLIGYGLGLFLQKIRSIKKEIK